MLINFFFSLSISDFRILVGDSTLSRNGEVHNVFLTYSTYLDPQKLVIFGLQLCPINHKNCRSWNLKPHSFLGKVWHHTVKQINHFQWRHEVCPLNQFSCTNLITSDNPISMRLQWIWNSAFWREVENLSKLHTYKTLPSLSQENRKTLPSALLDTSTTQQPKCVDFPQFWTVATQIKRIQ